jgi:C4-dicarboxylate-binding protein DctP
MPSDVMHKLFALAALAFTGGAIAGEAVLVHDIAPPHPRYTQLTQMAAEVAKRTQGTLTIAINPGGKVLYPGQASLDAVRNKTVPLAFINSAFLQSIDPDLGFLNLPFTITDQLMAKPGVAEGVLALVRGYVEPRGLKVFALMRGADTIVIFKNRQVRTPDDMKGLKIRVAGPGVYQDIVRSLGAAPVVFPAIEMGAALARGAMDGIITSPGGWGKNVQDAPSASLVPGLLFYIYFLIADKGWFDALPEVEQKALADSGRVSVTEKWSEMQADDARLVAELVGRGATYTVMPGDAVAAWRERTAGVTQDFAAKHPEVMRRFRAIVGAE